MCYNLRRNPCLTSVNILYFLEKCHFCLNSEREMVMGTCPSCGKKLRIVAGGASIVGSEPPTPPAVAGIQPFSARPLWQGFASACCPCASAGCHSSIFFDWSRYFLLSRYSRRSACLSQRDRLCESPDPGDRSLATAAFTVWYLHLLRRYKNGRAYRKGPPVFYTGALESPLANRLK